MHWRRRGSDSHVDIRINDWCHVSVDNATVKDGSMCDVERLHFCTVRSVRRGQIERCSDRVEYSILVITSLNTDRCLNIDHRLVVVYIGHRNLGLYPFSATVIRVTRVGLLLT